MDDLYKLELSKFMHNFSIKFIPKYFADYVLELKLISTIQDRPIKILCYLLIQQIEFKNQLNFRELNFGASYQINEETIIS